jgi:hypothetical protein
VGADGPRSLCWLHGAQAGAPRQPVRIAQASRPHPGGFRTTHGCDDGQARDVHDPERPEQERGSALQNSLVPAGRCRRREHRGGQERAGRPALGGGQPR